MKKLILFGFIGFALNASLYADEVIRIYGKGNQTIMEIRQQGQLKRVTVDPKNGPKYHFVNHRGLGSPVTNKPETFFEMNTPSWIIKEW